MSGYEMQRLIEVSDGPDDMPGKHAVIIWHSPKQSTTLYLSTAELNDLVSNGIRRLYETENLTWG